MGLDLYTLKKKAIIILQPDGSRSTAHILQLGVTNALSPDVQKIVDKSIQSAYRDWESWEFVPELVVQVGIEGLPKPGAPIFLWGKKRVYCFDNELLKPVGFLGNKELGGFAFRSLEEQRWLDDLTTAREIDEGHARVYQDFWMGKTFQSGDEFLAYRRGESDHRNGKYEGTRIRKTSSNNRLTKILKLIKHIEVKGEQASKADIQFLSNLREKASQLGSCFQ